eukprot:2622371-Rhodomonas_salina.2
MRCLDSEERGRRVQLSLLRAAGRSRLYAESAVLCGVGADVLGGISSNADEGIDACLGGEKVPGDVVPPSSAPNPWQGRGSPWEDEEVGPACSLPVASMPVVFVKRPHASGKLMLISDS